ATTVMFFLAEIGDKTQIATVVLAARYTDTIWVIIGTTVGMLLANVPVIMAGRWLMDKIPLATARICASLLFVALAVFTVWTTLMNSWTLTWSMLLQDEYERESRVMQLIYCLALMLGRTMVVPVLQASAKPASQPATA